MKATELNKFAQFLYDKEWLIGRSVAEAVDAFMQHEQEEEQPQTVEKWEDFELYDVFETAIQESALTVVTKYHNLDEETTELALECVRLFKELKGTTDKNKQ